MPVSTIPASCIADCAKGSSIDWVDEGVTGMPLALLMLSDAVEPCVKLVISENAEGEPGPSCAACEP